MITRLLIFIAALTLGAVPAAATQFAVIPSTYQAVYVDCSKQGMDTAVIQAKLTALKSGQYLRLPDAECKTDKSLVLRGKTNVAVVGGGSDRSIITATSPYSGSFNIQGGSQITIGDFQVRYSPLAAKRGGEPATDCFVANIAGVGRPKFVTINGVKGVDCTGAGVLLVGAEDSLVTNSEIVRSRADAYHATVGSRNILVQFNRADQPGDDGLASIGNKSSSSTNYNITFADNQITRGKANGCHFDNTQGGKCLRNKVVSVGLSCAAVSTDGNWSAMNSNHIQIAGNTCEGTNTRTIYSYGVFSIYNCCGSSAPLGPDIVIGPANVVRNPVSGPGVRMWGAAPKQATATGNSFCGLGGRRMILVQGGSLTQSGNVSTAVCQ